MMLRRGLGVLILILCFGLLLGCPKKSVMKEQPSGKAGGAVGSAEAERERERERARQLEAERQAAERAEKERAEKERADKDFEKSLVAKKYPGIEGEVLESALLKDVRFDFDRYEVRPDDIDTLKENAALLRKYAKLKVQIEGHCDERGTAEYNLALGERRANGVRKYLVSLGIPENRVSTISYGKERPLDPGHTEEAWAKNRRAHFVVLK
jgi:peptidoglycan-associated lipoprotein